MVSIAEDYVALTNYYQRLVPGSLPGSVRWWIVVSGICFLITLTESLRLTSIIKAQTCVWRQCVIILLADIFCPPACFPVSGRDKIKCGEVLALLTGKERPERFKPPTLESITTELTYRVTGLQFNPLRWGTSRSQAIVISYPLLSKPNKFRKINFSR